MDEAIIKEQEIVVGLDIGTTKIACFVGVPTQEGRVRIIGFSKTKSMGVEHGVVRNVTETANAIKRVVAEASEQANVEVEEVWVGIAGQHINSSPSQGSIMIPPEHRLITQEDVDNLINDQYKLQLPAGEKIIHVFPQQYVVDNAPLSNNVSPVGVAGKKLQADFHMVTGNVQNLEHIKYAVHDAGLKIKGVVLEPVASAKAVLDDTDRQAGVAMVDIGGGTTDIAVFHDGIIRHTSVLPLAGNAITNDIREVCFVTLKQAEGLKVKFGSCMPSAVSENDVISIPGIRNQPAREIYVKTLAGIINERTKMILEQVDYDIKLSGFSKKLLAGLVLTGGGAQLKNVKDLAELLTATETRIGVPNEHLEMDSVSYEELSHPMYATGIGLVLYGLEQIELDRLLHGKPTEEEKSKNDGHTDIFKDLPPAPPKPEPQPEQQPEPEVQPKGKGRKEDGTKKPNFETVLRDWFSNVFNEKGIDN